MKPDYGVSRSVAAMDKPHSDADALREEMAKRRAIAQERADQLRMQLRDAEQVIAACDAALGQYEKQENVMASPGDSVPC